MATNDSDSKVYEVKETQRIKTNDTQFIRTQTNQQGFKQEKEQQKQQENQTSNQNQKK